MVSSSPYFTSRLPAGHGLLVALRPALLGILREHVLLSPTHEVAVGGVQACREQCAVMLWIDDGCCTLAALKQLTPVARIAVCTTLGVPATPVAPAAQAARIRSPFRALSPRHMAPLAHTSAHISSSQVEERGHRSSRQSSSAHGIKKGEQYLAHWSQSSTRARDGSLQFPCNWKSCCRKLFRQFPRSSCESHQAPMASKKVSNALLTGLLVP